MSTQNLRVLIVADNASSQFGGEAILPWHIFRVLRKRGVEAWLLVHERTRDHLIQDFPEDSDRIYFVPDWLIHRQLYAISKRLPVFIGAWTTGYLSRLITQLAQRKRLKTLISELDIDVVHQPTPVSPKEPSFIFGLGVPVVIGPMNGGMEYPPAFRRQRSNILIHLSMQAGRLLAKGLNVLIPGKRQATALLVANMRTHEALPIRNHPNVQYLVENGVDLSLWHNHAMLRTEEDTATVPMAELALHSRQPDLIKTRFVFVGRLVEWKAVDLLLLAFKQVIECSPSTLEIIGSGNEYAKLKDLAKKLDLSVSSSRGGADICIQSDVHFSGWLSQHDCAKRLQASDVLVLPSLYECGGAVILEAMAMGLPAIATKWGGPVDYLDESCGILVEPASRERFIQGLVDAMCDLAQNPKKRAVMGETGRDRVRAHFDWDAKVGRMLEIYSQVVSCPSNLEGKSLQASSQDSSLFSKS